MAQDIVNIRRQLKQVNSSLRQGKMMPAAQTVISALRLMISTPLMKAEKEEMGNLVREAIDYLNNDQSLRKVYPLALEYQAGDEKKLLSNMVELLDILKEDAMTGVEEISKAIALKKQSALDEGQGHLDAKNFDKARAVFGAISNEFSEDGELKGIIGEKALNAGLYEDAAKYLSEAVEIDPYALHLYNRLAIALRKMARFDVAEDYYMRALPMAPEDPYLLFNIGRLYAEWGKWDKALEYGEKAHAILPEFEEAKKLALFSRRKL